MDFFAIKIIKINSFLRWSHEVFLSQKLHMYRINLLFVYLCQTFVSNKKERL